jgi:hypothetical protein
MDNLSMFAVAAGGLVTGLFLLRLSKSFTHSIGAILEISKYLYPYFVNRHAIIGPWTYGKVSMYLLYVATNIFVSLFKLHSISEAGRRTGTLAIVNLGLLIYMPYLDLQADVLGVPLRLCHWTHRVIGWTVGLLAAVHVTICLVYDPNLELRNQKHLFPFIVCIPYYPIANFILMAGRLLFLYLYCFFYPFLFYGEYLITFSSSLIVSSRRPSSISCGVIYRTTRSSRGCTYTSH